MSDRHPDEDRLYARLNDLCISYEVVEHEAVFTVEDGQEIKARLPGGHTKNLFLKDKADQFVLICALGDTPIRLNKLHPHIGTKRLSFGREEALVEHLGVRPGSVTFFSILNDEAHTVRLVLDAGLFEHDHLWFHPLRNTASLKIASSDLEKFAEATDHDPLILDLTALSRED